MLHAARRISLVFGTRPEAIKLCPLVLAMRAHPDWDPRVCATGQHRELLDSAMAAFGIAPDADLRVMQHNQTLAELTSRTLSALDDYLDAARPDMVIVQGDTTTVLCAALAAFYRRIPIGHVEAGLRTGNRLAPFPEEMNRVLASRLADLHFAPTEFARQNLLREGVPSENIFVTGNTVVDALLYVLNRVRANPPTVDGLPDFLQPAAAAGHARPPVVLITGHRRESFGDALANICRAIAVLARRFPRTHFVYPVHLNPHVREPVRRLLGNDAQETAPHGNIHLIEPLEYLPFVAMMGRATLILTDSGGVQEEAPTLAKPVLVMRDATERPEGVEAGVARLVGTRTETIVEGVASLLADPHARAAVANAVNPYGDGKACERILAACGQFLAVSPASQTEPPAPRATVHTASRHPVGGCA